ncbi:MAG TPA: hypothetical protein VGR32_09490 [Brevundimonas sp.]|jgi:hypothetical protein|uniref:hypothetical protein n=1 Tax=Brevundimonas sp. TaxID=1871086 RepID=UPI002DF4473F|nr:hypothetical protein [Brevundimonas sp.]
MAAPRGLVVVLFLIVLAFALFAGWWSNRRTEYFPVGLADEMADCIVHGIERPAMGPDEAEGFADALADFREPSLFRRPERAGRSVRLTYLPSLIGDDVVVRIDALPDGRQHMIAKRKTSGGDEMIDRVLSPAEAANLEQVLQRTDFFSLPPSGCSPFPDGVQWILEGWSPATGYAYRQRQSPEPGVERTLGLHLAGLTGWTLEPVF